MANSDNPNIDQVRELINFCSSHRHNFIFGDDEPQQLLAKFLMSAGVSVTGFITDLPKKTIVVPFTPPPTYSLEEVDKKYSKVPFFHKHKVFKNCGVIISNPDFTYNFIHNLLIKAGFRDLYFLSEWNKRTIPHKMRPRCRENFWLEVNLADHCNLNCRCCDHFAPIADKYCLPIEEFEKDMERLANLMDGHIGIFKIQGGEPTLHPRLIDFMRITREKFPKSTIFFFTNGILLNKLENGVNGNLWQAIKDYDVTLMVTTYPTKLNYKRIDELAKKYEVKYKRFVEIGVEASGQVGDLSLTKMSVHHPLKLDGSIEKYQYISCYQFNESITLRHGRIYTCPFIPYSVYFNKYFNKNLKITNKDFIDIYEAKSFEEIAEFCTHRTDFCN